MAGIWESVASQLKTRMNVARINSKLGGISTSKRFKIEKSPEIILLRHGKFYRFDLNNFEIKTLVNFAQNWYKNVPAEKVAVPATPL